MRIVRIVMVSKWVREGDCWVGAEWSRGVNCMVVCLRGLLLG